MVLISIILLLVNAVSSRRDSTIFKNWIAILILLYSGILAVLILGSNYTGIGIYGGLFLKTIITHSLETVIYILSAIVIQFTAFTLDALQEASSLCYIDWSFFALAVPTLSSDATNSSNTLNKILPVAPERFYEDAAASKDQIIKDNRGKAGVYLIFFC
jgi:hypothetical protein